MFGGGGGDRVGMAQWWEHPSPANATWIQFADLHYMWVEFIVPSLFWEVFLQLLWFSPISKTNISEFQFNLDQSAEYGRTW